ncbi:MAG: AEC family transporter [Candidatus Omnitrophota bacterium]
MEYSLAEFENMFFESFKITGLAMAQIFLLGGIGYLLVRRNVLGDSCLVTLSRLSMDVTLPLMIFVQISREFKFSLYPDWWVFPLMSLAVTAAGALAAVLFLPFVGKGRQRLEFISLAAFQNSGYLPLALIAAMMPAGQARPLFIYTFLFLMGFNLLIWSFGVYMLSHSKEKKFALASLFSAPVIATLSGLLIVACGANRFLPDFLMTPLKMTGDCTLPLALFVVGGGLARIKLGNSEGSGQVALLCLLKLLIMPLAGLALVGVFKMPYLMGLLMVMQLAMPPATSLSVIVMTGNSQDLLISRGIFFGHIVSLVSIPLILSLYFAFYMIK